MIAILLVLGVLLARTAAFEARELDHRGEATSLERVAAAAQLVQLASAELERGEEASFELCSSDRMGDAWAARGRVELLHGETTVSSFPLDETVRALARRSARGACLEVGRGILELSGIYRLGLAFDGPAPDAQIRGRIIARRPIGPLERNLALALLGAGFATILAYALRGTARRSEGSRRLRGLAAWGRRRLLRAVRHGSLSRAIGLVFFAVIALLLAALLIPVIFPGGATSGLLAGLLLAAVELALAYTLSAGRLDRLGLRRPPSARRAWIFFALAPIVGVLLFRFAHLALSHVEPTGEAPIEAFVSWPSGRLAFVTLALVAPLAEEVFFRGFVFGAIDDERWGGRRALAFVLAAGLFGLAHVEQVWGNWGGLLAVSVAGLAFTALRAASGSTLVSALAHLTYNALLAITSLVR